MNSNLQYYSLSCTLDYHRAAAQVDLVLVSQIPCLRREFRLGPNTSPEWVSAPSEDPASDLVLPYRNPCPRREIRLGPSACL